MSTENPELVCGARCYGTSISRVKKACNSIYRFLLEMQQAVSMMKRAMFSTLPRLTGSRNLLAYYDSELMCPRDFAANIGIPFQTPEEYFLGQQAKIFKSRFDFTPHLTITEPRMSFKRLHDLEVVLFCGSPGAGKSTFFKTQLAPLGYKRINQDILKSVSITFSC